MRFTLSHKPSGFTVAAGSVLAAALLIAGCSSSSGAGSAGSTTSTPAPSASAPSSAPGNSSAGVQSAAGGTVEAHTGPLGSYLTDAGGKTLYLWEADKPGISNCTGGCATAWPPLTSTAEPVAGTGLQASKLGTLKRSDGSTQVSYNGWPLYYFIMDKAAGDTTGQGNDGFGAKWWVVSPSGSAITSAGSGPSSASSNTKVGGYG